MMASTSRLGDSSVRTDAPASRRSISSQAASASRALTSVASTSVSSPYAGLPSSSSSSSSSSSLSTPRRRSIVAAGRNSFSRYSASSSSTSSLVNDNSSQQGRRSVSASSNNNNNIDEETEPIPSISRTAEANAHNNSQTAATRAAKRSPRHQRHHSAESLRLDLDGLDLGGNQDYISPSDNAPGQRHVRSRSNNATQPSFPASKQPFDNPTYNRFDVDMDRFCASCATQGRTHEALNGLEDSFSLHLRAECSDYREIMSSQVVLNAAVDKEQRMRNSSLETTDPQRPRGYSISNGQVLGGFASLGLQTETGAEPPAPTRQQPVRSITKGSTDSSGAPITPIEWRDSFGTLAAPSYTPPPKWAHLTGRPCNPLEPLDVLSIQEMGFHSLDIGSLNDWEGCKLSAEILCPINGHQRIEWSVAQTTRRNKKWVVVPNATVTCGTTETLSSAAQAERTVVVSNRSLWLDESEAGVASLGQRDQAPSGSASQSLQRLPASNRVFKPFSGKAGFELRLLRPTVGKICPPIYLANASTHRYLHQYRKENGPRSSQVNGAFIMDTATDADRQSTKASQPIYPVLRRSRSRPYLRHPHAPVRRSRSKPYLRYSAQQQAAEAAEAAPSRINPEEFAPSLPGDPLVRTHPGESWPSARSRHSNSLSSFDSGSSSDAGSDTSSDDAGLSATNTRESVMGSMSSASYDQPARKDMNGERARSAAIPMAVTGSHLGRAPRSLSPGSSASRGISSNSEASAASAGWQHSSLEQQRYQQQYPGSASYEADSWQGTSPTTASASSLSASSKQSRSRKGLQKALQKKDKMLSSWFKRRPENATAAQSVSPGTERELAQLSSNGMSSQGQASASSSTRSSLARDRLDESVASAIAGSVASAIAGSTPLTETALESFQRAMFRPASPESTIMGSRRGSEALTQKTIEPSAPAVQANSTRASQERTGGTDNRSAVNSTLSQVYGWDEEQAAKKLLRPVATGSFVDLDEENALLGLDAVPAGALTMLIPLPLIGRARAQDAVRYMRVNFVPFGSFTDPFEAPQGVGGGALLNAGSPGAESEPSSLSQSMSTGSGSFASHREAAKSSEQSSWKRKLGLSGGRGGGGQGATQNASVQGANGQSVQLGTQEAPQSPPLGKPEAFRITAIVHDAPWTSTSRSSELDARLPESGTFPVVLGYCNGSKGLEMVPEGWGALRLAGVATPTNADGSAIQGIHPLHGVTDLIIAACTAVMDV
ncbi:uncharacterized protein UTRI_06108 [Ustilago trichophora]|uniref:Uncharacterized protein n=1 Tax=Ustilago trichophora TaxID=86804 RepID=A0A5C3EIT9_9BASI|nr:uncharacterized protein UTRI_06108 [Ustilago trichophora]